MVFSVSKGAASARRARDK